MQKELEASLKRLQVDYIDLYQFHWPDKAHPVQRSWEQLVKFKKAGKIRFLGVSNFDVKLMKLCQKIHPIDSLQPPYNMLRRDIENEILPFCEEHGIGVIAYSPMHSGLLTGNFDPSRMAGDDWPCAHPMFRDPLVFEVLKFVDQLRPIAAKYRKTVGQLAISWVLRKSVISSAIVGARLAEQVVENVLGSGWQIDADDLLLIDELIANLKLK